MTVTTSCSVPILAGPHGRSRTAILALVSAVILAGCGGDSGFSKSDIEEMANERLQAGLPGLGANANVDPVECVEADEGDWLCRGYVRNDSGLYRFTVAVTCDTEECLFDTREVHPSG